MNRIFLSLATVTSFVTLTACGPALREAKTTDAAKARPAHAAKKAPKTAPDADDLPDAADQVGFTARKPGDYVVYRFSGTFRRAPITMTERVVAREGTFLIVDMTFEEGKSKQQLRVRLNDAPGARGDVFSVSRMEGGIEKPATLGLYEELMARTALVADQNEAVLASEPVSIDVGSSSVPCTKTSYRVKVARREATMRTCASPSFAWGDVGAEITTKEGTVLYRAELVDVGNAPPAKDAALATSDE
jgi:hypothetical protein